MHNKVIMAHGFFGKGYESEETTIKKMVMHTLQAFNLFQSQEALSH